jgi:ribonucleoside-triphosphate reductase
MGSWHVVTLNVPRAAYRAEHDTDAFIDNLKNLVDLAIDFFAMKRKWMEPLINGNRLPFLQQHPRDPNTGERGPQLYDFDSLVYTIGVVGVNDAVKYHTGSAIHEDPAAWELAIRAMTELQAYCRQAGSERGFKIALARTPAESCAQRLAVADLLNPEFTDKCRRVVAGDVSEAIRRYIKTKSRDLPIYYSNGTHIPVSADISLFDRLRYEQVFYHCFDGGDLTHVFLGEAKPDAEGLMELGLNIVKNTQIGYFAPGRDLTLCLDDAYVEGGLHETCANCGSHNVEHIARVTGYMSAVSSWNEGKKQELKDRTRITLGRTV